ncbi:senescence-specific cysteine protease SAG39-like [Triticum aestivum]|uniref:senescence-specific cysteine protease SAG39-like n=1 Tax=Triticum aestivum TaxID=4565 RepID=UPI001D011F79|nr:senescence-specific cysteine protease SAG39-like [Triticum aestivum]
MAIHRALLLAILGCICLCGTVIATRELNNELLMVIKHEKWMAQYGRVYKDATEKARRFKQRWTGGPRELSPLSRINASASSYTYNATDGKCKAGSNSAATSTGFEDVPANSEGSLMMAVANQPVFVAVDEDDMTFQFYSGEVMTSSCGTDLDHGIAAIGYGKTSDGTSYWLMKNSWGTTWGEDG